MSIDALSLRRRSDGSTSAPARNVSTMPANDARKSIHGVDVTPSALPAIAPNAISMIATDSPSSTLSIDASRTETPTMVAMSSWSTSPSANRRSASSPPLSIGRGHQPRWARRSTAGLIADDG
jgi:hypothetical protein